MYFQSLEAQKQQYAYQESKNNGIEKRVDDLLSRMSLEEKVRQMDMYRGWEFKEDEDFSSKKTKENIGKLGVGAIHDIYPQSAKMINDLQTYVIQKRPLGNTSFDHV